MIRFSWPESAPPSGTLSGTDDGIPGRRSPSSMHHLPAGSGEGSDAAIACRLPCPADVSFGKGGEPALETRLTPEIDLYVVSVGWFVVPPAQSNGNIYHLTVSL